MPISSTSSGPCPDPCSGSRRSRRVRGRWGRCRFSYAGSRWKSASRPMSPVPIQAAPQKILKASALDQAVKLAALRAGPEGDILMLLDADDDCWHWRPNCPKRHGRHDRTALTHVLVAKSEYESWFGVTRSRSGTRRDVNQQADPSGRSCRPTLDQAALLTTARCGSENVMCRLHNVIHALHFTRRSRSAILLPPSPHGSNVGPVRATARL